MNEAVYFDPTSTDTSDWRQATTVAAMLEAATVTTPLLPTTAPLKWSNTITDTLALLLLLATGSSTACKDTL